MFSSAGLSPPIARYCTLALGIVYFVSTCSAAYLIERLGRRRLSIFQLSSITVVLGLVSVFAWFQQTNQAFWLAYTMIALFVVYMSVYGIGSPIPWMITGEIFPTNFRPMAVTVTVFVSFANAFIVSLGYLPLKQAVGVSISYLPFIVISGISSALVYFLLPETKIEQALQ
uniref:Major facilitator superfamily (MFS) profile domain-containing protein n=1 Tax=Ditylenchus dipsaci TaxID=166011 RepID=A0A915E420_9BILA